MSWNWFSKKLEPMYTYVAIVLFFVISNSSKNKFNQAKRLVGMG